MHRLVMTARLQEGARERAVELAGSRPTPPNADGFTRFSIYISEFEVVFLIEGPDAQSVVRQIFNDPVRSTEIGPWLSLFDGPLHRADEVYHWAADPAE